MAKRHKRGVHGLRNVTPEEIEAMKAKNPNGVHVTHKLDGIKLPFNGNFYFNKHNATLESWANLENK